MVKASIPCRRGLLVAFLLLIVSSSVGCTNPKVTGRARFNSPTSGTIGSVWIDVTVQEDQETSATTTKVEVYGHSSSNASLPSAPYGYAFETVNNPMTGDPPKWMLVNDQREWDSTEKYYFVIVIVHEGMYSKRWWKMWQMGTMPSIRMEPFHEE